MHVGASADQRLDLAVCWLTSLVPSTALKVTSVYSPACALALVVMAAIQPWSAAGAEKPMVIALPGVSLSPPSVVGRLVVGVVAPLSLLVHAVEQRAGADRAAPSEEAAGGDGRCGHWS